VSYARRNSFGNAVIRGAGLAAGFALFNFVVGIVSGATVGLWSWTDQINPAARWLVRGLLLGGLVIGILILLSDL
jgi:hypothetical protein